MIKRLQLTNFMRHQNLDLTFGSGLQVLKGSNEAGKSTVATALAYALFGSRALRTTIEDAVTWGQPVTSLKVVLHFGDYVFSRGPRGAEVTLNGKVFVTGQNEVTNFAASLLGVDAAAAPKLMLANQGNLRGALEQGPKAAATMIEELGNFDLFENLIQRMQDKLLLGAPAPLESALARAKQQESEFLVPEKPDRDKVDKYLARHREAVSKYKSALPSLQDEAAAAEAEATRMQTLANSKKRTAQQLKSAQEQKVYHEESRDKALQQAQTRPTAHAIEVLREKLKGCASQAQAIVAWEAYNRYVEPAHVWEGTRESFDEALVELRAKESNSLSETRKCEADIRVLEAQRINGTLCGYCGKDFSEVPEVAKKNAEIATQVSHLQARFTAANRELLGLAAEIKQMEALQKDARRTEQTLNNLSRYLQPDLSHYPPKLMWVGGEIATEVLDPVVLKAELDVLEAQLTAAEKAAARAEAMAQTIAEDQVRISQLEDELAAASEITEEKLNAALVKSQSVSSRLRNLEMDARLAENTIASSEKEYVTALSTYNQAAETQTKLAAAVAQCETDIKALHFNNALLKKIRAARPIVADKLWGAVLAAVSTMFSAMRGEKSVVSKGGDGFMVNGQTVTSLSGSTLDILGLSIRCALVKTFLPTCPFLLLDEPGQGCDSNRVAALLAFLSSNGIEQTILVTHDSIAESVADNLIEI